MAHFIELTTAWWTVKLLSDFLGGGRKARPEKKLDEQSTTPAYILPTGQMRKRNI